VQFGDQYYDFFRGQPCEPDIENGCPWQNRTRPLHYGPFSDPYVAAKNGDSRFELQDDRPVYYQRGQESSTVVEGEVNPFGKISYCAEEEACWVFTIEGVTKSRQDKCNWLIVSPKTLAYSLHEAPLTDWEIWTGVLSPADPFEISCIDCDSEVDCNYHGVCNTDSKECTCNFPWAGRNCQVCAACTELSQTLTTYYDSFTPFSFKVLSGISPYERPAYYRNDSFVLSFEDPSTAIEIMFYAGTRFYVVGWNYFLSESNVVLESDLDRLRDFFKGFHSTWNLDDNENRTMIFYTEVTTKGMPIEVQWNEAAESKYITIINENVSGDPVPIDLAFDCAIEAEKDSCAFAESSKEY
jgi:hypothetical protein